MAIDPEHSGDPAPGNLFVAGGTLVLPDGPRRSDLRITNGLLTEFGELTPRAGEPVLDASERWVFPGQVDAQVHFREPGNEHKEDLASGSTAAVVGGATAFMEMPNTKPATTDADALLDKFARAKGRASADYAFFAGATHKNVDLLPELEKIPGCPGVKIFMGSSTGDLLVPDDETLEQILRNCQRRVTVHSEDEHILHANYLALPRGTPVTEHPNVRSVEAALRSTTRLLDLAERTQQPVHLLHVSTADEIELVRERDLGDLVTVEITPNHLFLCAPDCYVEHGTWAQMNPPVRGAEHRDRLRQALVDGVATCIGSDHAPHTAEEKDRPYPQAPSGIPGVQTTLTLLLTAVRDGWLQLSDIPRLITTGPCGVYGVRGKGWFEPGTDGDLVLVDPKRHEPLDEGWLLSRSRTNPFVGRELAGLPVATVLRGEVIARDGEVVAAGRGRPLEFAG